MQRSTRREIVTRAHHGQVDVRQLQFWWCHTLAKQWEGVCVRTWDTPGPPTTCGTPLGGIMCIHSKKEMLSAPREFWSLHSPQLPWKHQAWLQAFSWLLWGYQGEFCHGDKGCDHSLDLPCLGEAMGALQSQRFPPTKQPQEQLLHTGKSFGLLWPESGGPWHVPATPWPWNLPLLCSKGTALCWKNAPTAAPYGKVDSPTKADPAFFGHLEKAVKFLCWKSTESARNTVLARNRWTEAHVSKHCHNFSVRWRRREKGSALSGMPFAHWCAACGCHGCSFLSWEKHRTTLNTAKRLIAINFCEGCLLCTENPYRWVSQQSWMSRLLDATQWASGW